jgi:hypothetical protein
MNENQSIIKASELFVHLKTSLQNEVGKGTSLTEIERMIFDLLLPIGKALEEGYVESFGTGDVGSTIEQEGQIYHRFEKLHEKRYISVFGEMQIARTAYGKREGQKQEIIPLDARLNLPESDFSYVLQSWDQELCVNNSYKKSSHTIEEILGIGQSVRSLETMNRAMAGEVETYWQSLPTPEANQEGGILVATLDGKGVPIVRRGAEAKSPKTQERRKKGEKANKTKQVNMAVVYSIAPFPRTAEDVINELQRKEQKEKRPAPCHKRMRAEMSREVEGKEISGKETGFEWAAQEVAQRNPEGKKTVVCLMDGELALWRKAETYLPNAIGILDLFHVMEYLWLAGYCFYKEGSEAAKTFVTACLRRILQGEIGRVIGGLKQRETKHPLKGYLKKQLKSVITYFENHRQFMHYDYYLDCGYPIGSGVAEGACRYVVKDRMEQTGMRWTVKGAQAMLSLRAVFLNGDWKDFQQYRIRQQQEILYPYRNLTNRLWGYSM